MRQAAQRAAKRRYKDIHSDNEEDSDFEMSGEDGLQCPLDSLLGPLECRLLLELKVTRRRVRVTVYRIKISPYSD